MSTEHKNQITDEDGYRDYKKEFETWKNEVKNSDNKSNKCCKMSVIMNKIINKIKQVINVIKVKINGVLEVVGYNYVGYKVDIEHLMKEVIERIPNELEDLKNNVSDYDGRIDTNKQEIEDLEYRVDDTEYQLEECIKDEYLGDLKDDIKSLSDQSETIEKNHDRLVEQHNSLKGVINSLVDLKNTKNEIKYKQDLGLIGKSEVEYSHELTEVLSKFCSDLIIELNKLNGSK